jgi:hypothetical protein
MGSRCDVRLDLLKPFVEKRRERRLGRLDVGALGEFRYEAGTLGLRLALGSAERMPLAFAHARLRVAQVEDDGPVTGRPFADVTVSFWRSLSLPERATLRESEQNFAVRRRPVSVPTWNGFPQR